MRPRNDSQSDDERTLHPSDEDILQEDEDKEHLLAAPSSSFGKLLKRHDDPNQPRPWIQSDTRKQRRRRRRSKRKKATNEDGLIFEMEETGRLSSASSEGHEEEIEPMFPTEVFLDKSQSRSTRRRRLAHLFIIPLALLGLLLLFTMGAYKATNNRRTLSIPAKIPKILRSNGTSNFAPTTILVSLDGFRADFLSRGLTPTLNSFISEGISPKYMSPSFPSLTFPNHWSIVTGLYPESHGIVGNTFWDPALGEEFYYTDTARSMQPKWWTSTGAEPLWSTCEQQGVRSAVHMWPGSEAGIAPEPQTVDKFNHSEVLTRKVSRVLSFLDRPSEHDSENNVIPSEARPQFIAMYVPNVDNHGHKYGPNSTQIRSTIQNVDTMLSDLFSGLSVRNLTDIVNIIVLSDHGMATTATSRLIQLDGLVDPDLIEHIDGWPLYGLRPRSDVDISTLHANLKAAADADGNFKVYLRTEMPARWHFSMSDRIAPIWIIPDPGWAVVRKTEFDVLEAQDLGRIYKPRGLHGYDNEHPLMRAIFIARGPAFPHEGNSRVEVFQNIEVYNIVCDSLDVEPKPNNGTLRLPFSTAGKHDTLPSEEEAGDLSADTDEEEPASDGTEGQGETEGNDSEESFMEKVWDKISATKQWVKDFFKSVGDRFKGGS